MKKILLSLSVLVVIASCKKEHQDITTSNRKELLTANKWKRAGYYFYPVETGVIRDLYADFDDCDKDEILRLNADNTYTEEAGTLRCDSFSSPILWKGKWTLTGQLENELTLTPDMAGTRPFTFYISRLTSDSLVLYFLTQPKDTVYKYISSYVKN